MREGKEVHSEFLIDREGYFVPFPLFDFGEPVIVEIVVGIHIDDLALGGSSQNFDDFDEVVDAAVSDEKGHSVDHLQDDASH
ncbi:unnamed protein product [Sphagnum balticum]